MIFPFGKKKDNNADHEHEKKKSTLDDIEADLTVLDKDEMNKVEGGKTNNSFGSLGDLRDSLGSTIPL